MKGVEREGKMEYASRMKDLGTETAFEVLARAKEIEKTGKKVVHLEIGEVEPVAYFDPR